MLALLWHAPQPAITAGGLRRTFEILKRAPDDVEICVLDSYPTFLRQVDRSNVTVLEYKIPGAMRKLQDRFFRFERSLEWILSTVLMTMFCLKLRLKRRSFDTIYVPSSEQIPALLAGIGAKFLFSARLVTCNTNMDIFPRVARAPLARLHNAADVVIAISNHLLNKLKDYGVSSQVVVNGVGLNTDAISGVASPDRKEYDAIFVGRHDPEKGVFDLVEIWRSVVNRRPSCKLIMIGSCSPVNREKLDSLISEYGLENNIITMGAVDDNTKFSLIKGSKICLFPSYVEEWGIVPQEALVCGLPVVAYDLPVYEENIKPLKAVFLEPVGDIPAMAEATADLLSDDEYRKYQPVGPESVRRSSWDEVAAREFQILSDSTAMVEHDKGRKLLYGAGGGTVDAPPAERMAAFKHLALFYCRLFRSTKTFRFRGVDCHYFYHPYNLAWENERTVEIPIARGFLTAHEGQEILEVGNVLSHYLPVTHDILDKYEVADGVISEDALCFAPRKQYNLIISISTLEHIGYDEGPKDPGKVITSVKNLAGLLAPGGVMMATVPLGYNPELDRLLEQQKIPFSEIFALKRVSDKNEWVETDFESVRGAEYARNVSRANAIVVGVIREGQVESTSDRNHY